jgi:predicted Zn-dependent peptidase
LGDEKSITNLRYEDMMLEYKKLFDKSRITFVASGDISIDELVTRLNTLYFLEGNDFVQKDDVCSISEDKKILATFFDAPQTYICFGVPAPKSFSKELLHLNLLGDILAGGRASRLIKRLRYNKGLVYGVTYGRSGGLEFGSWRISTDTTENKVQEVINEIIEEIKDIRNNGVKDSELEFVKIKRVKSLKRTMQTSNDWVDFHASAEVFSSEIYNINTFVKDIEETTIEDIKLVVDTYLVKNKWQLALCGRTKEESINIKW